MNGGGTIGSVVQAMDMGKRTTVKVSASREVTNVPKTTLPEGARTTARIPGAADNRRQGEPQSSPGADPETTEQPGEPAAVV